MYSLRLHGHSSSIKHSPSQMSRNSSLSSAPQTMQCTVSTSSCRSSASSSGMYTWSLARTFLSSSTTPSISPLGLPGSSALSAVSLAVCSVAGASSPGWRGVLGLSASVVVSIVESLLALRRLLSGSAAESRMRALRLMRLKRCLHRGHLDSRSAH